jgi:hypothetical protein
MAGKGKDIQKSSHASERVDTLIASIGDLILSARRAAVRSVDTLQVFMSFEIGRRIVEDGSHIIQIVIVKPQSEMDFQAT